MCGHAAASGYANIMEWALTHRKNQKSFEDTNEWGADYGIISQASIACDTVIVGILENLINPSKFLRR